MGFPYDPNSWDGVSGAIFVGFGSGAPAVYSIIAIALAVGALLLGNRTELGKYKDHE